MVPGQSCFVVIAFKTKSASKNKFMIEWFQSKRDELICAKNPVKLHENCEPVSLLADPKDSRSVYVLCVNRSNSSTSLHKVNKGKRQEEAIHTFNFEVMTSSLWLNQRASTFVSGRVGGHWLVCRSKRDLVDL